MIIRSIIVNILLVIFVLQIAIKDVYASKDEPAPAFISADNLTYNQKDLIITAIGNVEILQEERLLLADKVVYDRKKDQVTAIGNVSLLEPQGSVLFASRVFLKNKFKQGVINNFKARLNDNSLMAANEANKVSETITKLKKAIYSPCPVCEDDISSSPQWQLKAKNVEIDEGEEKVTYKNAFFEVYGMPILYTPYISHATPGAKRKSGFLVPRYGNSGRLGNELEVPYYFNIKPNIDLEVAPMLSSREEPVLKSNYRHLTTKGMYEIDSSITNAVRLDDNGKRTDDKEIKGHVKAQGRFDIKDHWQWGFDANRTTDDTYLLKYGLGHEDTLTSNLFLERLHNGSYVTVDNLSFQGLNQEDDPSTTPVVLPLLNSHFETKKLPWKSTAFLNTNIMALDRHIGSKSRRISSTAGWEKSHISNAGHILDFRASVRGDLYSVENVLVRSNGGTSLKEEDGLETRAIPQAELTWRFPLVRQGDSRKTFVEPISRVIISPYGGNPDKIPNEDSQDVEFSDENLFDSNRFSGLDRVENGPRVNYGFRSGVYTNNNDKFNFIFGQSYKIKEDKNFTKRSGLNDNLSDYVGKISFDKDSAVQTAYKFRLNKDDGSAQRSELSMQFDVSPFKFNSSYIRFNDITAVEEDEDIISEDVSQISKEFINSSLEVLLINDWSLVGTGYRDLDNGKWVSAGSQLKYEGICTDLIFSMNRDFTSDRDAPPSTSFSFFVSFKNLN